MYVFANAAGNAQLTCHGPSLPGPGGTLHMLRGTPQALSMTRQGPPLRACTCGFVQYHNACAPGVEGQARGISSAQLLQLVNSRVFDLLDVIPAPRVLSLVECEL